MRQYTDKTLTFFVAGLDLTALSSLYFTLRQGSVTIDITDVTVVTPSKFTVTFTQAQTALLKVGKASAQLNFFINGMRDATGTETICITENLKKAVLANE